jgi:molybdopterin synthase catalytic subunit
MLILTTQLLKVGDNSFFNPCIGCQIYFEGIVRNAPEDHGVKGIEYSAFNDMCSKVCDEFSKTMKYAYPQISIKIMHRLGFVPVGESSLLVIVSSPHRKDTFSVLEQTVEWIKGNLPVWKKIIYLDGKTEWRSNAK